MDFFEEQSVGVRLAHQVYHVGHLGLESLQHSRVVGAVAFL